MADYDYDLSPEGDDFYPDFYPDNYVLSDDDTSSPWSENEGFPPMSIYQLYYSCIYPTINDGLNHILKAVAWCIVYRVTTQTGMLIITLFWKYWNPTSSLYMSSQYSSAVNPHDFLHLWLYGHVPFLCQLHAVYAIPRSDCLFDSSSLFHFEEETVWLDVYIGMYFISFGLVSSIRC